MIFKFPDSFSKNIQVLNFMKIHPVGAERTDEQTYMTKVIVVFRNFANATNNRVSRGGGELKWLGVLGAPRFQKIII